MSLTIDVALLPPNALIDTGVFIRFLGHQPNESITPLCKAFCDAMIDNQRPLYIAAPTIAEVTRYTGNRLPRTRGLVVVPFDDRAAELLGLNMPMAKIHETSSASGLSRTYLKYDAMIAACALRAKAMALVALDGDHTTMAGAIGIKVTRPELYERKQLLLPGTT